MARPAFKAQLTGDKEMKAKLATLAAEGTDKGIRREAREALKSVGTPMLETAGERAPERTGKLKRSRRLLVMVSPKREDLRIALVFGGASRGVLYAAKVEATHKTHAHFLQSTLMDNAGSAGRQLATHIDLRRAANA